MMSPACVPALATRELCDRQEVLADATEADAVEVGHGSTDR